MGQLGLFAAHDSQERARFVDLPVCASSGSVGGEEVVARHALELHLRPCGKLPGVQRRGRQRRDVGRGEFAWPIL